MLKNEAGKYVANAAKGKAGQAKARTESRFPGRLAGLTEQQRGYIREERSRGVSQWELAKPLEISRWTIQQVEGGGEWFTAATRIPGVAQVGHHYSPTVAHYRGTISRHYRRALRTPRLLTDCRQAKPHSPLLPSALVIPSTAPTRILHISSQ